MSSVSWLSSTQLWEPSIYYPKCTKNLKIILLVVPSYQGMAYTSKYIDFFIKPLVRELQSFIEDFWKKKGILPNVHTEFLVPMNVDSTRTLTISRGLELNCHPSGIWDSAPSEFVLEVTEWVIHHNVFLFMDELYIQKVTIPMGSCFSPNYSILVYVKVNGRVSMSSMHSIFFCDPTVQNRNK